MKYDYIKTIRQSIIFLSLVVLISINISNNALAQTRELYIPEVQYTTLEDYYSTGAEIACTARVYSNGLIDKLCSIYYEVYKDDFDTPITSIGSYGRVSYTVRSQGDNYVTENITNGSGYLSVKPLFTTYKAFTLGIFDNYCTNRNRPVALSMTFNEPGIYKFNAEIQSCTNTGSSVFTSFTVAENPPEGCAAGSHSDKAASTCSNPTALFSEAIFLTICDDNSIAFLSGKAEYCPGEEINLVYDIGEYDDEVDMTLLPTWITPVINQNANTLTLTGNAPNYDSENPTINFDVRILSTINPIGCPGATVNQTITITNAQKPVISGNNMICEGGTVVLTSDIAATWLSSDIEVATIEQTVPDAEVTVTAQNMGTTTITCQEFSSGCNLISDEFILSVNENYETILTETICEGDSYLFGGEELSIAGEYTLNLTSQYGCDSIYKLNLIVNSIYSIQEEASICEGETFEWQGEAYSEAGTYYAEYISEFGCDSIYELNLIVNPIYSIQEEETICNGETFQWQGESYVETGTYYAEYISEFGCDSIYKLNLIVNPVYFIQEEASICEGDSYLFGEEELSIAGEYTLNLTSQFGCDSIVQLSLQVNELSNSEFYIEGESYTWNEIEYTESGDYIQTFSNINGCDSIVNLHFTFSCDECFIEFLSGNTQYCPSAAINMIYNIGEYNDSVDIALLPVWVIPVIDQNAHTLTLTGNAPAYDAENPTINFDVRILLTTSPAICPGATVNQSITIIDAQTPIISGDNIMCEGGTVTLTSDIAATWSSSDTEIATIEQTAPDTEVIVTAQNSGTAIITCQITDNICDVTSNNFIFTVNENYETILTETICEGESYLFGGEEHSVTGEYTLNLTSQYGCDSISKLNLIVNPVYSILEEETICDGETFEWQGEFYSVAGTYYAEYISEFGCDSIYELNLIVNPVYSIQEEASICEGDSYLFGGEELSIAGEYTLNLTSQFGCDSIIILTLHVYELSNTEFDIEEESYTWNEIEYTESGDYVQMFSNVNGCDSIVTLHLTVVTDIISSSIVKETIDMYPNPVSEMLHIDITRDNNTTYSIIVTDITGKVLIKKDYALENNILDLSHISGGIYFISIMSDNKIIYTSMINKE